MKLTGPERGEARLRKQARAAAMHHKNLLDRDNPRLSLESGLGKLVIIVSGKPNLKESVLSPEQQYAAFMQEAERIKTTRNKDHQVVEIRERSVPSDMKYDFSDPEVTDITLIGHGSISDFWADHGYENFDWRNAAQATRHLKQGVIEQRVCGHFPGGTPFHVPLGTFAVSKFSHVLAAPGSALPDTDPGDRVLVPVFNDQVDILQQLDDLHYAHFDMPVELVEGE